MSNIDLTTTTMKDQQQPGPLQPRPEPGTESTPIFEAPGPRVRRAAANGKPPKPKVDPWMFADVLAQRWHWLFLSGLIAAGAFYFLGINFIKPKFTASAQLIRLRTPGAEDFFKTAEISGETLSGLIRAPELLRKVADRAFEAHGIPPLPPEKFIKIFKVEPEPDSDMIKVSLAARNKEHAVHLLNVYVTEAVQFTKDLQARDAAKLANDYLKQQVVALDADISALHRQFRNMPADPRVTNKLAEIGGSLSSLNQDLATAPRMNLSIARQAERLQTALGELNDLMLRYTDIHPAVQAKREQIKTLEGQIASASTNPPAAGPAAALAPAGIALLGARAPGEFNPELDIIRMKLLSLEDGRVDLAKRQREAKMYSEDPPGVIRVFAPADLQTVESNMRPVKIAVVSVLGGLMGMAAALCLVLLVEFADNRLKTADDLTRVTRLPVLTSLGDLRELSPEARAQWAFRTWTLLQGRLSPSPNHGLVCGITSSTAGEGRSTWIKLLAEAASLTGFRVLTIATKPSPTRVNPAEASSPEQPSPPQDVPMNKTGNNGAHALTTSVLSSPMQVTERLTGPNSQPMVHIPLPGWVWNLERRKQWREALAHWRGIDNLVILVELPPASVPESVLLGSNLPNMLWLADSGAAHAGETKTQIETLRNARCNLVGAVLNREGSPSLRSRFPRWLGCAAAALVLATSQAQAQLFPPDQSPTRNRPAEQFPASASPAARVEPAGQAGSPVSPSAGAGTSQQVRSAAEAADAVSQPATNDLSELQPAQAPLNTGLPPTGGRFSVVHPSQKAAWQQRLTLGPGDVLNLGLYGAPELSRAEVAVGPDGRISYLEAQDILAAGKTIDELRGALDEALGKYRRAPRSLVTPVAFKSKKYFILGKVMSKGVYLLDRPMTVLEAIARAKGTESGLVDRNVIDLADFQKSFLARDGKRIPLNFERLFQEGDLSQNIAIEPGDYIYIPGMDSQEVYVVGEVRLPGPVSYTPQTTIIAAIAARGGYSERAYKSRVIVVRGSINRPEAYAVDTHDILDGRAQNFRLQPKDIIYVNSRPFIRVEELADFAATAFIQSVITTWVGVDVVKPIQ